MVHLSIKEILSNDDVRIISGLQIYSAKHHYNQGQITTTFMQGSKGIRQWLMMIQKITPSVD